MVIITIQHYSDSLSFMCDRERFLWWTIVLGEFIILRLCSELPSIVFDIYVDYNNHYYSYHNNQ